MKDIAEHLLATRSAVYTDQLFEKAKAAEEKK